MRVPVSELLLFAGINIGLPAVMKVGLWLHPATSLRVSVVLAVAPLILAANFWRGFSSVTPKSQYILIAGLNVLTYLLIGNVSFLLSLGQIMSLQRAVVG